MEYFLIVENESFLEYVKLPFDYVKIDINKVDEISKAPEAFVIAGNHANFFEEVSKKIRHLDSPKIYLKPIIFITDNKLEPKIAGLSDESFNLAEIDQNSYRFELKKIDSINNAIKRINISEDDTEDDLVLRILRFIYTRGGVVEPVRDRTSFFGLTYPSLNSFFSKEDYGLFNTLKFLEENGSLSGEFFGKVHLCNRCHCSSLNFMEVCPNCGSPDLMEENLIHHFTCAFVGPEGDFLKGEQMICPKCGKKLKGIGVDYDKPGVIFKCNQCGYVTQEPEVKTLCFNCGKESLPEDLIVRVFKTYTLSSIGENFAIYGFENPMLRGLREKLEIIPYDSFLSILKLEIERSKRYGVESSMIAFQINNLNELYVRLGGKTDSFFKEIGNLIKMSIRDSDVLSIINEGLVLILLTHTPYKDGIVVINRLVNEIYNLVSGNIGIKLNVESSSVGISKNSGISVPNELLEEVLKNLKKVTI